jgi:hypothetical protein
MLGVSRTTLWRMVHAGTFPSPVRISEGSVGYLLESVEAWIRARADGLPWQASAPVQRAVTRLAVARTAREAR